MALILRSPCIAEKEMSDMDKGFDPALFRTSLLRNLSLVGLFAFGSMTAIMVLGVVIGMIGVIAGELAILHELALLGMAAGSGVLTALCAAVAEGYGVKVFQDEKGEQDHE